MKQMENFNSIYDILEYAISRETESIRFYTEIAGQIETPAVRNIFGRLVQEETKHKSRLELELLKLGKTVKTELAKVDLNDTDFMFPPEPDLQEEYRNALTWAILREKVSFRLYVRMAELVKDEAELREVLLTLAEEEARHRALFEIEYDRLAARKD